MRKAIVWKRQLDWRPVHRLDIWLGVIATSLEQVHEEQKLGTLAGVTTPPNCEPPFL